jgi:hypothetical protein
MIKETNYWPRWQKNRIEFILSKYTKEFFRNKRILELGSHNGYIGAYFQSLGADVYSVEGRELNVNNIKRDYPDLKIETYNLDTPEWKWGYFDIIINFGLFYHLENFHKEHLNNCLENCNLMFFESVIFDSFDNEIHFRNEFGNAQSLSDVGGSPSTSYVENIFKLKNVEYQKYSNKELNGHDHHYDWKDLNTKKLNQFARRFWIINCKK